MFTHFAEAIRLLRNNIGLLSAIILTVWLPGNILINYVAYYVGADSIAGIMRLSMWIENIFGPIYIGALIYSLFRIKSGHSVTYKEAMSIGVSKWGALFGARFVAGILVGLGFIALVIPGLVLLVRYSLLDAPVVIENMGASESRARSAALTQGRRWKIFLAGTLFFILFFILSFAIYIPIGFFPAFDNMLVSTLIDSLLDVVFAVIQIVMFLFYWEAINDQSLVESAHGLYGENAG